MPASPGNRRKETGDGIGALLSTGDGGVGTNRKEKERKKEEENNIKLG